MRQHDSRESEDDFGQPQMSTGACASAIRIAVSQERKRILKALQELANNPPPFTRDRITHFNTCQDAATIVGEP